MITVYMNQMKRRLREGALLTQQERSNPCNLELKIN